MDAFFIWEMHNNIYSAKVNAIIPWATVQRSSKWVAATRTLAPPSGLTIAATSRWKKAITSSNRSAGRVSRGCRWPQVRSNEPDIVLIGFAGNGTKNPDAFVVVNVNEEAMDVDIEVLGSAASFTAYRTSETERYVAAGTFHITGGAIAYQAPAMSVTTFYGTPT